MALNCLLSLACALLFFMPLVTGAEEFSIETWKHGAQKIDLGVGFFALNPEDEAAGKKAGEQRSILLQDLEISGLFNIYDVSKYSADFLQGFENAENIDFKKWYLIGTQSLAVGALEISGNEVTLTGRLYDAYNGKYIFGKKYQGPARTLREITHRFADEIVYRFTGMKGIATTKIGFIGTESGNKEIYYMDYDGQSPVKVTGLKSITTSPAWMPGNAGFAFTSYFQKNPDIYFFDLEGKKLKRIFSFPGVNLAPAFSPDGKRMALSLSKDGNSELYLCDADGSNLMRLTNHSAIDTSPSWAPNGREIAFCSDRSGRSQIYKMDVDGLNLMRLTSDIYANGSPEWSPTGEFIAFSSERDLRTDICIMDVLGKNVKVVTSNVKRGQTIKNEGPSWAPDGYHLAFSSNRDGKYNVYIMNVDGSGQRRLTFNKGDNYQPAWSPW